MPDMPSWEGGGFHNALPEREAEGQPSLLQWLFKQKTGIPSPMPIYGMIPSGDALKYEAFALPSLRAAFARRGNISQSAVKVHF